MPSKNKPLSKKQLEAFEAERDLGADLLQAIREMKAGQGKVVYSEAIEARKKTGLSQSQFASLLGVSGNCWCSIGASGKLFAIASGE